MNWRRLSITLRDQPISAGALPTTELLDIALAVISQGRHRPGDWRLEGWLFRVALRAVCEATLECKHLPLPLAVTLSADPRKDTWPPMPRISLPAFSETAERQPGRPLRFFVNLEEPCILGEAPLSDLLDAALNVLPDGHHPPGCWRRKRRFFRVALRAVCEAVLASETGCLPLPLRVRLHRREETMQQTLQSRVRLFAFALQANPQSVR